MPGTAGWTGCEPGASKVQGCGHAGLASEQPGVTGVGGKAWGPATTNAPAGGVGVGCIHTHAALVGPALSLAGRLRKGDAILAPASGTVQHHRQPQPEPPLACPATENTAVGTAGIPVAAAEQVWDASAAAAATWRLFDRAWACRGLRGPARGSMRDPARVSYKCARRLEWRLNSLPRPASGGTLAGLPLSMLRPAGAGRGHSYARGPSGPSLVSG